MAEGTIFAIEEFSVFDGPGIRTTVFMKGCHLSCSWCHNPEGKSIQPEILKNPNGCTGCKECEKEALRITGKKVLVEECIAVCPKNLIRRCGIRYTSDELYEKLIKNKKFYQSSGGGVTFSGGEPLLQAEFVLSVLEKLNDKIHRCIQTSGSCDRAVFSEILKETDLFLFDFKLIEAERLKKYTNADSKTVYDNFDLLYQSGVPFIIRIPLIPTVTDTKENILDIIKLLKYYHITYAEALPYNQLAGSKYPLAGKQYLPQFDPAIPINIPTEEFQRNGIELKVL